MALHILFIGAHPDDCDFAAGGTALQMARAGHQVRFVAITNGDRGHMAPLYLADRSLLAQRRREEAEAAIAYLPGSYETLGIHDGEVYVTPENTEAMVRCIRSWGAPGEGPDLVITNRPNDYHRDHRYGSQLVLDASYLLTVPAFCPDVPHLKRMPIIAYWYDRFSEGGRFRPDVVAPIDSVFEQKVLMVGEHKSQLFEWLPYNQGDLDSVPISSADRFTWLEERLARRSEMVMQDLEKAGIRPAASVRYAEAFQISEYGRPPDPEEVAALFPGASLQTPAQSEPDLENIVGACFL